MTDTTQQAEGTKAPEKHTFADLRLIDVSAHLKQKQNLSYLSWARAVDELLQRDPDATWDYAFGQENVAGKDQAPVMVNVPYVRIGQTAMVFCTVRAFGVTRTAQLPVMDHRNKAIPNPDAFQVNNAMQRCLVKAIALHGIALYIYEGEDIPDDATKEEEPPKLTEEDIKAAKDALANCETLDELRETYNNFNEITREVTKEFAKTLKAKLEKKTAKAE